MEPSHPSPGPAPGLGPFLDGPGARARPPRRSRSRKERGPEKTLPFQAGHRGKAQGRRPPGGPPEASRRSPGGGPGGARSERAREKPPPPVPRAPEALGGRAPGWRGPRRRRPRSRRGSGARGRSRRAGGRASAPAAGGRRGGGRGGPPPLEPELCKWAPVGIGVQRLVRRSPLSGAGVCEMGACGQVEAGRTMGPYWVLPIPRRVPTAPGRCAVSAIVSFRASRLQSLLGRSQCADGTGQRCATRDL